MFDFVKGHSTRKITVLALTGSVLAYIVVSLVLVNANSVSLYRTFVKLHDSLETAVSETSLLSYRSHTDDHKNESKRDSQLNTLDLLQRLVTHDQKSWNNITNISLVTTTPMLKISPTITPAPDRPLTCDGCFNVNFLFLINNENICISNNKSIDILLLITSAPQNILARNTIRETWLTHTHHNKGQVRYVFLLGKSQANVEIYQENERTKDIILADFQDAYSNLTLKTLMGFQWTLQYCRTAKFVMKTDDDMYVNIPGLITRIKDHNDSLQTAVGGSCAVAAAPIRDKHSKWYASYTSYPQNSYPGFCSGTGYVTSMNVVSKVFEISKNIPFFHLEDVYVSLCVRKLGYRLHPLKGFLDRPQLDPCLYKNNNLVTAHQVPITWMQQIWNKPCLRP